jgi:hypothetical protein
MSNRIRRRRYCLKPLSEFNACPLANGGRKKNNFGHLVDLSQNHRFQVVIRRIN